MGHARYPASRILSVADPFASIPVGAASRTHHVSGVAFMQMIEERTDTVLDARQLLTALNAFKKGDFSVRLDFGENGVAQEGGRRV